MYNAMKIRMDKITFFGLKKCFVNCKTYMESIACRAYAENLISSFHALLNGPC